MNREEFEALVGRMELSAARHPVGYRWRVIGWAVLGYGFLFTVVLALLAICAGLVYVLRNHVAVAAKVLFVIVPALFVVVRALWVRFHPPEGERVTREEAPELFALVDDLSRKLATPRVHEVLVTPELNASVTQIPRLGFLGWHRNYLMLGLPLMKGLTVEQFRAVIAHELGHLSRGHARLGNWIYRLRLIWANLEQTYSQQARAGAAVIRKFFGWYSPRFKAISFPLARANEFEADSASAQMTSPRAAAQALTGINVLASYLDRKFWPDIHAAAREHPEPGFSPYSGFVGNEILRIPEDARQGWLKEALSQRTSCADTHPSLTDRLQAIGCEAEFAPPTDAAGAGCLLGSALARLEKHFDEQWRERVAASWAQFHEETARSRARLAELRSEEMPAEPSEDLLLELADLEQRVGSGAQTALALRRSAVERFSGSAIARFLLARQLLEAGEEEGVGLMQSALSADESLAEAGSVALRDFHWRRGDRRTANEWHDRYVEHAARRSEAQREREEILTSDTFVHHGVEEQPLRRLVEGLGAIPAVRRAYLVRKVTRHHADVPMYVLGFSCSRFLERHDRQRAAATLDEIRNKLEFPGETLILCVDGPNKTFASTFRSVGGSRIV